MTELFAPHTKTFTPISLDDLNTRAALLSREENKYLVTTDEFIALLGDLQTKFDILKIGDETAFSYKSVYFDTGDFLGYSHHHQGRTKRRFKVRTRHYVESGLCFFEVKLKSKRGGTIKKRIPYAVDDYGTLTSAAKTFLKQCYEEVYGRTFKHDLESQLEVTYTRITLVAKAGGERMTIDYNLSFGNEDTTTPIKSFLIIETKSSNGRGIADAVFKKHGIKSRSCSKYCLGANLLDYKVKRNQFKPLLKLYESLPFYHHNAKASAKNQPARAQRPRSNAKHLPAVIHRLQTEDEVLYC